MVAWIPILIAMAALGIGAAVGIGAATALRLGAPAAEVQVGAVTGGGGEQNWILLIILGIVAMVVMWFLFFRGK